MAPARSTQPIPQAAGSTLTLGGVWGMDEGWSSQPLLWNANVRLPNGRYIAKVSITSRYRTLFDIARRTPLCGSRSGSAGGPAAISEALPPRLWGPRSGER